MDKKKFESDKLTKFYCVTENVVLHLAKAAGMSADDLEKYYHPQPQFDIKNSVTSINDIYLRFLLSLQNRQRMSNIINLWNQMDLYYRSALFDYNPNVITKQYKSAQELYSSIKHLFHTENTKMTMQWCQGALDGANELAKYSTHEEIKQKWNAIWLQSPLDLPNEWSQKIKGMGFALSCDFFKEIGYDLPKPDVHIRKVFKQVFNDNLYNVEKDEELCSAFIDAVKQLNNRGIRVTTYKFDRMIWLACTGNFFLEDKKKVPLKLRDRLIAQCE